MTRLFLTVTALFALFHGAALALGSDRGQAGVLVGLLVVVAVLGVERLTSGESLASSAKAIGLGRPRSIGLLVAMAASLVQLMVIPVFAQAVGAAASLTPRGLWLLPGLFVQGGIAEEVLFRGYLFGHLRRRHSFWRAACVSMAPFVAAHLLIFATVPWPLALAALVVSAATTVPFAHLFELGGSTIWPPALFHFVVQGLVKVTVVSGGAGERFPLVWMAAAVSLSLLTLFVPRDSRVGADLSCKRLHDGP